MKGNLTQVEADFHKKVVVDTIAIIKRNADLIKMAFVDANATPSETKRAILTISVTASTIALISAAMNLKIIAGNLTKEVTQDDIADAAGYAIANFFMVTADKQQLQQMLPEQLSDLSEDIRKALIGILPKRNFQLNDLKSKM